MSVLSIDHAASKILRFKPDFAATLRPGSSIVPFADRTISGANLSGALLMRTNLQRANLTGANLSGALVISAKLGHAKLANAKLTGAILLDSELMNANLRQARFGSAIVLYDNLRNAQLTRATFTRAVMLGAMLTGAELTQTNLNDADLRRTIFDHANLTGAQLNKANLIDARLQEADLTRVTMRDATLISANVHGADLDHANIQGSDFFNANVSGASLYSTNCTHAYLFANLAHAYLVGASLTDADLEANLSGASLYGADLTRAYMMGANLTDADLETANLTGATLFGANVTNAKLAEVNLTRATYVPSSHAPDPYVVGIIGLDTLIGSPHDQVGMVQLRKLLQDAGLRGDERKLTYSIERNITADQLASSFWSLDWSLGVLRFLGCDITTGYGLYPSRALLEIVALGGLFTLVYFWQIWRVPNDPGSGAGIFAIYPADRIGDASNAPTIEKDVTASRIEADTPWAAFRKAAWFSLMSAVNIGFEQFNPGEWLGRMQTREYTLQAVGWVRVIAGLQSVVSVYLLAIWALTQFGRPFD